MYKDARIWNRFAKGYSKSAIADEASYQKKLFMTQEHFTKDMHVLEIGCGTGSTALIHAPYVDNILATDFSDKMIEIAKQKARDQNITNINFQHVSIDALELAECSKDMILALSVLHLLNNKDHAIAKMYDYLKPNGLFVTSTVCLGDAMPFFKVIGPIGRALGLLPIVKVFKQDTLVQSIKAAGFKIETCWRANNDKKKAVFIIARKPA